MLATYSVLLIVFLVILYKLFFGLRETLYFYNMINPYKVLLFFVLTITYLVIQIWIMSAMIFSENLELSDPGNNKSVVAYLEGT